MKKIKFITTNKHKVAEMQEILKGYGIELEQVVMEYEEDKEASMDEICAKAASELSVELNCPVIVEDTGLYFNAYNNFPGALPKFVFNSIGFKGIFKLLKDEDKGACFKTFIGYCEVGKEPMLFSGEMKGRILDEIVLPDVDIMPYDKIFIPDGFDRTIVEMTLEEKNKFSHRSKATKKFGEFLNNKNN